MRDEIFQESPRLKVLWLKATADLLPVGSRVRVVASDVPAYVGARGQVVGYDLGIHGEYPLVSVKFDEPIDNTAQDGFYFDAAADDEIVKE